MVTQTFQRSERVNNFSLFPLIVLLNHFTFDTLQMYSRFKTKRNIDHSLFHKNPIFTDTLSTGEINGTLILKKIQRLTSYSSFL